MNTEFEPTADRVVIIGGGPGGYEAALVAAQLGADVMLIERNRCGGAAVLTDVVPSKSLIATAEMMEEIARSESLGIRIYDSEGDDGDTVIADLKAVNKRILSLADA
ncbi:MAG: FAD-dependent oxidoreductase, partial [Brevibacterium aurantiacum]